MVKLTRSSHRRYDDKGTSSSNWLFALNNGTFLVIVMTFCAFYGGVLLGMHLGGGDCIGTGGGGGVGVVRRDGESFVSKAKVELLVKERVEEILSKQAISEKQRERMTAHREPEHRFGPTMSSFATGIVKTGKQNLLELFDCGFPKSLRENFHSDDAVILYNKKDALPSDRSRAEAAMFDDGTGIPMLSAEDATANCDILNIVITQSTDRQCLAIVGGYESYHLHKWMRVKEGGVGELNRNLPLTYVGRGMDSNGRNRFLPPSARHIKNNWTMLRTYLNSVDDVLKQLRTVAEKVAKDNTIIVMVCNAGQSDLLMNFFCSSKAKGIDVDNILVFATDQETFDIATGLGVTAFYDDKIFASLPSQEAKYYGDKTFVAMMYAKVVTVQLVNMLGYDVLFQDVDIVWYRNPLEIFHDKSSPLQQFDILFQDDGARTTRYAPYSANSGFYYVRYNGRTRYLFTSLLYAGDLIMSTKSHQQALTALLSDHSSLYGLKIKTLNGDDFPGGFHYHRRKDLMRSMVQGKITPWLFHMSWTNNKDNKLLYFKQMGQWFVKEECEAGKALDVLNGDGEGKKNVNQFVGSCCSADAIISCHYKDKPSVINCNDSPPIDKGGQPFWLSTMQTRTIQ